jgi:tRNA-Thr(GGU) m(6)t(6)A37 methyltransferase TsaA
MMTIEYQPIGLIRSPFKTAEGMPIQPAGATDITGTVEVFREFRAGLRDLEGFSHLILLYHFHRSQGFQLEVVPFLDSQAHGLFATRAPRRPNAIGLSVVRLLAVAEDILQIGHPDVLDGTPLLDIKPYVPAFDAPTEVRTGWLERAEHNVAMRIADGRFQEPS